MHYKSCNKCGKIIKKEDICECITDRRKEYQREYSKEYSEENPEFVKPLKTARWQRLRKNIINRDGGYCQRCKNLLGELTTEDLEVHHIKPRSEYPELIFDPTNLITLCSTCNKVLGTSGELDFEPSKEIKGINFNIF